MLSDGQPAIAGPGDWNGPGDQFSCPGTGEEIPVTMFIIFNIYLIEF